MTPPTRPPTADELLAEPVVRQEMEAAWTDSLADDPANRHEEGGWVYQDIATGRIAVRRAPPGSMRRLDLGNPPLVPGSVIVGTYHTHPNPTADGWEPGPSAVDVRNAALSGVPW